MRWPVFRRRAKVPSSKNAQAGGDFPRRAYILNPDIVMTSLPEYQQLVDKEGLETAFAKLEMPARDLAYQWFAEAAKRRVDIIKDMASAREENYVMLTDLKRVRLPH